MRRRDLSEEELTQVINLKRAGTSWVKIQYQTGINRRTVKRAYDKWERSQSMQELKEARKEVAAAEFRGHMNSLITLAVSLVTNLSVPHLPAMMEKNAEQFFSWLWEQHLLQRWVAIPVETKEAYGPIPGARVVDPQLNRRENELLFQSLKVHTREKVRWKALDEWKEARDNCVKVLGRLRKETSEVVRNFLNQERQMNLLKVKQASREDDPVKRMVEAMLTAMWQSILRDELDQECPLFETVQDIYVISSGQTVLSFNDSADKSLAEKVAHICNLTANNLRNGVESHMVKSLQNEVRVMKKATEELREMLHPIKLTPVILRTRCDLCPA